MNESVELVVDLLAATKLVPEDKLALARGRAQQTRLARRRARRGRRRLERGHRPDARGPAPAAARRPRAHRRRRRGRDARCRSTSSSASSRSRTRSTDGVLRVAVADPANLHGIDELRLATRHPLELGVASRDDILAAIRKLVRASEAFGSRAIAVEEEELLAEDDEEDVTDLEADDGVSDVPLVRLVNSILFQAAEDGASDVHFEPQEDSLVVRFRIDGVLQEMQRIPKRLMPGVTTRLKVLAKLDIAERRKPQDGRISLNAAAAGRMLDVRVATLPTVEGESVVMRLLDKSKKPPTLEELGLSEEMRDDARRRSSSGRPARCSSPARPAPVSRRRSSPRSTRSTGRRSTSSRSRIRSSTGSPGINQVQINQRAGLTFAAALRSILRSDPDVVMVGEIRDGETAKISIEAALTGHLVLSTLHTNDAPSALTRLNEMGVEPFLTGAAVTGVLAQRLARKLCTHCCEMYTPSVDEMIAARVSPDVAAASDGMAFYRKRGCPRCNQTGYKGRIGIFQLLAMTEDLASLAAKHATREEIERAAIEGGMRTLWDDGLAKVAAGLTSIEELARVTV